MKAAFVASLALLSLACFAAAETAFYQDAAFLELVSPAFKYHTGMRPAPMEAAALCKQ